MSSTNDKIRDSYLLQYVGGVLLLLFFTNLLCAQRRDAPATIYLDYTDSSFFIRQGNNGLISGTGTASLPLTDRFTWGRFTEHQKEFTFYTADFDSFQNNPLWSIESYDVQDFQKNYTYYTENLREEQKLSFLQAIDTNSYYYIHKNDFPFYCAGKRDLFLISWRDDRVKLKLNTGVELSIPCDTMHAQAALLYSCRLCAIPRLDKKQGRALAKKLLGDSIDLEDSIVIEALAFQAKPYSEAEPWIHLSLSAHKKPFIYLSRLEIQTQGLLSYYNSNSRGHFFMPKMLRAKTCQQDTSIWILQRRPDAYLSKREKSFLRRKKNSYENYAFCCWREARNVKRIRRIRRRFGPYRTKQSEKAYAKNRNPYFIEKLKISRLDDSEISAKITKVLCFPEDYDFLNYRALRHVSYIAGKAASLD